MRETDEMVRAGQEACDNLVVYTHTIVLAVFVRGVGKYMFLTYV